MMDDQIVESVLSTIRERIRKHGWTAILTALEVPPVPYGYTIGFTEAFRFPEALVFGVSPHTAGAIFEELAVRLRSGERPPLDERLDLNLTMPVVLRAVPRQVARRRMNVANVVYHGRAEYDAVQVVWPDPRGFFPWEAGYGLPEGMYQPLLAPDPLPN